MFGQIIGFGLIGGMPSGFLVGESEGGGPTVTGPLVMAFEAEHVVTVAFDAAYSLTVALPAHFEGD